MNLILKYLYSVCFYTLDLGFSFTKYLIVIWNNKSILLYSILSNINLFKNNMMLPDLGKDCPV